MLLELGRLHPQRNLPIPVDITPQQTIFALEEVLQAALSFPKGSAAGPSGFRPSHLREALLCGASEVESSVLNTLTDFVNLCASGTLPVEITQVVLAATLIPFRKNSARDVFIVGGVRPIASGETLRRLVAKCVLKKVQDKFKAIVTPLQCGVAVPDAINSISFTMLRYYEMLVKEPQLGLMQLDLSNAFNSVDRSAISRIVCEKLPEASAWMEWVLCAAAPL